MTESLCDVCHALLPPAAAVCPNCGARPAGAVAAASDDEQERRDKKKDKLRSAWISFAGRIVAQIVGALATVALGLLVAGRLGRPAGGAKRAAPAASPAAAPVAARPGDNRVSIAVLPLGNLSGDAQQEYFADGMTEALIADLAKIQALRVVSRHSVMQYKDARKPLPEIARELGVDAVVEGSVMRAGRRVRVTAQLIDAETDEHLWADSYERDQSDVLALQADVARRIASEIKVAVTPQEQARLLGARRLDPEAHSLYLKGRHEWNKRTAEGFQAALAAFERALASDPNFALAHAGLADTYGLMGPGSGGDPGAAMAKSRAAAQRAIDLDDGLAEAHTSLAAVLHRGDGDVAAADRAFRRALELNPGYATAHQWYAILLAEEGRDAEATRHAESAVSVDPLSGAMLQTLGLVHYYGRRFAAAAAAERRALELAPQLALARSILARALLLDAKPGEAIDACGSVPCPQPPDLVAVLSAAHLRRGDAARAGALVAELEAQKPLPAAALARRHALAGDATAALAMLERTLAGGPALYRQVFSDPIFDGLRGDSRFAALAQRAARSPRPAA
jgi:TolB-like protein/Tfp pilus assembly protein PilF